MTAVVVTGRQGAVASRQVRELSVELAATLCGRCGQRREYARSQTRSENQLPGRDENGWQATSTTVNTMARRSGGGALGTVDSAAHIYHNGSARARESLTVWHEPVFELSNLRVTPLFLHTLLVPAPSTLSSVSDLVSKVWYRIPFDQSELSIRKSHRPTSRKSDRYAVLE